MGTSRSLAIVIAGTALLLVVAAPTALAAAGPTDPAAAPGALAQADDADDVVLRTQVRDDGSATWSVEYRYRLGDEETEAAFESLRQDVEANRSAYVDRFAARMENTVGAAENATGREMAVRNASVAVETRTLPREYGVVRYEFDWVGFAEVDGDRLRIGDALSGLFLDEGTRLIVGWSEDRVLDSVDPAPDERRDDAVVWQGPLDFGPGEPRVVVSAAGAGGASVPWFAVAAVGAVAALAVGATLWFRSRDGDVPVPAATDEGEDDEPPSELLSNEERVLRLIEDRGGRMKQQEVVQELDWTDAKTSQVVSDLREEGEVESFRLGRENVLKLPEENDESAT